MLNTILQLLGVILVALGGYIFSYAFRKGGRVAYAIIMGTILIGIGFMVFPNEPMNFELPQNYRK